MFHDFTGTGTVDASCAEWDPPQPGACPHTLEQRPRRRSIIHHQSSVIHIHHLLCSICTIIYIIIYTMRIMSIFILDNETIPILFFNSLPPWSPSREPRPCGPEIRTLERNP
jgi:hypothetical protein